MQQAILDALRAKANPEAIRLAREALLATPGDARLLRLLALGLQADGDSAAAMDAIDRAIGFAPDDSDLHMQRAGFLVGARNVAEAQQALARSLGLDPNQFAAYVMQAQLALAQGDLDGAERLQRLGARVAPDHPWLAAIEGTVALRRGNPDQALAVLVAAARRDPEDLQVAHALGFAYLAKDHLAFAEQVFATVLVRDPGNAAIRTLLADILRRQDRYADSADMLAPVVDNDVTATPPLRSLAGEMELMAGGRDDRALVLLEAAFAADPSYQRTLPALMEAWRRLGLGEHARTVLDAALATHPGLDMAWRARAALEQQREPALAVVTRWAAARPAHVPAMEAQMALQQADGDQAAAMGTALRILALEPGHAAAETRVLEDLLANDPGAAVGRIETLLGQARTDDARQLLARWLGTAQNSAGRWSDAVSTWRGIHADQVARRLPLPEMSAPRASWPALAAADDQAPPVAFLWGLPGSGVERVATVLNAAMPAFRGDRYGATPPADAFQNYRSVLRLSSGVDQPDEAVAQWRALLPQRGIEDGKIIDWLLWWDNSLLLMLRPHLPEAELLLVLRDPRDMLLDWLAFGSPIPMGMKSPLAAAGWMAMALNQVAVLHEQSLFPHTLLRVDAAFDDPRAMVQVVSEALQASLPIPPEGNRFGDRRFASGHWRHYSGPLGDAFAMLAPVAQRLGYPEA